MTTGRCLCGGVQYRVEAPLGPVTACHCSQCRRQTGHYAASARTEMAALRIEGELRWFQSSPQARRGFCPVCGSYLFWQEGDAVWVTAGTLDPPTGLRLSHHIFAADKGDYYEITDGLPCYARYSDGEAL